IAGQRFSASANTGPAPLLRMGEVGQPELELDGVDAGIRRRQARVRYVHEAHLQCWSPLAFTEVHAECGLRSEIHVVGEARHIVIAEQDATRELDKRRYAMRVGEIPLQSQRIEAGAVGGAVLEDDV